MLLHWSLKGPAWLCDSQKKFVSEASNALWPWPSMLRTRFLYMILAKDSSQIELSRMLWQMCCRKNDNIRQGAPVYSNDKPLRMATSQHALLYLSERHAEMLVEAGECPRLDGRNSMSFVKWTVRPEYISRTSQNLNESVLAKLYGQVEIKENHHML